MSVVKINAIEVPENAGPELEARFAARKHAVDSAAGFEGFQLLRPVSGESRYFVVTTWDSEESFQAWRENGAAAAHGGGEGGHGAHGAHASGKPPVATGASLLEFEIVEL
ncbi:antibiotic biosynthesis monooxygenase family protein [Gryllotalpicola reticulitermitis]|uniref:Antibiotic biosynthesis monooxygenase family protein n=1 Tax=Gryllotalpicola reticulitermitis TaxID=1184153 RepID=A0ABV8Q9N3_9MICO